MYKEPHGQGKFGAAALVVAFCGLMRGGEIAERKSKLPLPPLNPELQWVTGAASAALAS